MTIRMVCRARGAHVKWAPLGPPPAVPLLCSNRVPVLAPRPVAATTSQASFRSPWLFPSPFPPATSPLLAPVASFLSHPQVTRGSLLLVRDGLCRAGCPVGALPHLGSCQRCSERLFAVLAVECFLSLFCLSFLLSQGLMAFPHGDFAKRKAPLTTQVLVAVPRPGAKIGTPRLQL